MKKALLALIILSQLFITTSCTKQNTLDGEYVAQDLPQTEEVLVEKIVISGNSMSLTGKMSEQTLKYQIMGDKINFNTDYGDFSYSFKIIDEGLVIDGVEYIKKQ